MHIKNEDLDFLIELENKLGEAEGWSEDCFKLRILIEKLQKQRDKTRESTYRYVSKRREEDKNYARSKTAYSNTCRYNREAIVSISDVAAIERQFEDNNIEFIFIPEGYCGKFRFRSKDESIVESIIREHISKAYEADLEQRRKYGEA